MKNIDTEKQIAGLKATLKKYKKQNNEFRNILEHEIYYKIKSIPVSIHYIDEMIKRTQNNQKNLETQKCGLLKLQKELTDIYKKAQKIIK